MVIRRLPNTTRQHYLTGMTAMNIPSVEGTGDWHFHDSFIGYPGRLIAYFVAGVNFDSTNELFAEHGIFDCKPVLEEYGVFTPGDEISVEKPAGPIYAADHYRACADILIKRVKSDENMLYFSIDEWLSLPDEKARFWEFIQPAQALGPERWETITEWFHREMALA